MVQVTHTYKIMPGAGFDEQVLIRLGESAADYYYYH